MTSDRFAVILAKPEQLEVPAIAEALAKQRKIPFQDAVHEAKNCWGLVAMDVEEKEALALVSALRAAGLGGLSVPMSQLANVRPANMVAHISFETDGLAVEPTSKQKKIIPWPYFQVVAVAIYKTTTSKTYTTVEGPSAGEKLAKTGILLATGIPLPIAKKKTVTKKVEQSEFFMTMDLFIKQSGLRIRLDARKLDYSFLGPRMQHSADINFRAVLSDVLAKTPSALRNKGARVFAEGKPFNAVNYESPKDLDRECRWLMTLPV